MIGNQTMLKRLCCLLALACASHGTWALPAYPQHAVSLVVPFAAGGDADQFAQALAASVRQIPNAPELQISHVVGRSGTVASLAVRQAAPDGYTLLIARVASHAIQPAVDPGTPYRTKDFTVLAILEVDPLICAVLSGAPYTNTRDLLDAIRARPGTLRYSTSGQGTVLNFAVQYLLSISGLPPTAAVPAHFDSGRDAVRAVADGRADFTCAPASSTSPLVTAGTLRGLMVTATGRMETLPNVPNAREAGYRAMTQMVGWTALMGPPGLPADVVRYWKQTLQTVARDPVWLATNARLGGQPTIRLLTRPDVFVDEQYSLYRRLSPVPKGVP